MSPVSISEISGRINNPLLRFTVFFWSALFSFFNGNTQTFTFSKPERDAKIKNGFEILGKFNQKVFILKKNKSEFFVSVYNTRMELEENIALNSVPERAANLQVLKLKDYTTIWFRYTKGKSNKLLVLSLDKNGKTSGNPKQIISWTEQFSENKRSFYLTVSEDKMQIMVSIVHEIKEKKYHFKNLLLNHSLDSVRASETFLEGINHHDFYGEFTLDNDGNPLFCRGERDDDGLNLQKIFLYIQKMQSDSFTVRELIFENHYLNGFKIKIDNLKGRYLLTGFYCNNSNDDKVEGLVNAFYDKKSEVWSVKNIIPFNDDVKSMATTLRSSRFAMDDYALQNVLVSKDGSFMVFAEQIIPMADHDRFSRWTDNDNSEEDEVDFLIPSSAIRPVNGPLFAYPGIPNDGGKYATGNLMIFEFSPDGDFIRSNVLYKNQSSGGSDIALLGYYTCVTPDEIHLFYNSLEKNYVMLYHQTLDKSGKLSRSPSVILKQASNPVAIPFLGKQVGLMTFIVPCMEGGDLIFAKVDL